MYVGHSNGLRMPPRGLGEWCAAGLAYDPADGSCNPAPAVGAEVFGCAPNICLDWRFPWLGRRTENPVPGGAPCVCRPIFELPSPFGAVISYSLAALVAYRIVRGVTG